MATSYVDIHGEWEQRRISIVGVAKSFIGQLRVGQDLTRVSLPSVFLRPYSLLEEFGSRTTGRFHMLYDIADEPDPTERLLRVVWWYIAMFKNETYHHKPYNPVLGEVHKCKVEKDVDGKTTIYAVIEQVSHHPPRTACRFDAPSKNIVVENNIEPTVKFYRNSVTVNSVGKSVVHLGPETYFISKGMPDLHIQNTILGRKYVHWIGHVEFECPSTGLGATIEFSWKDNCNQFEGRLFKKLKPAISFHSEYNLTQRFADIQLHNGSSTPPDSSAAPKKSMSASSLRDITSLEDDGTVLFIEGQNGASFYTIDPSSGSKKGKSKERVLSFDCAQAHLTVPTYPPLDQQDEMSSLRVWEEVSKAIVDNDMPRADEAKKKVEDAQRARIKAAEESGTRHVSTYFRHDAVNDFWEVTDPTWYLKAKELL